MLHFTSVDLSIARTDFTDERALIDAIDSGARVVVFDTVVTLGTGYFAGRRRHLVQRHETPLGVAAWPLLVTLTCGWWGLGIVYVPAAIYRNLTGGVDVTLHARAELLLRLEAKERKAEEERQTTEAVSRPGAPVAARRVRVLALLERGDAEGAWALAGEDVASGEGLAQDEEVLRRLFMALVAKKLWRRAETVAAVLRTDHRSALEGYIAAAVERAPANASRTDGYTPPTPLWMQAVIVVGALAAIVFLIAAVTGNIERR